MSQHGSDDAGSPSPPAAEPATSPTTAEAFPTQQVNTVSPAPLAEADAASSTCSVQYEGTETAAAASAPVAATTLLPSTITTSQSCDPVLDSSSTPLRLSTSPGSTVHGMFADVESPPPKAPISRAHLISVTAVTATAVDASAPAEQHRDPITQHLTAVSAHLVTTQEGTAVQGRVLRTSTDATVNHAELIQRGRVIAPDSSSGATAPADVTTAVPTASVSEVRAISFNQDRASVSVGKPLSEVQRYLREMRTQTKRKDLLVRYVQQNAVRGDDLPSSPHAQRLFSAPSSSAWQSSLGLMGLGSGSSTTRARNQQVLKRKLILLGYQEVGKTSLRKCFESEPYFFKNLPEVRTTTGVEVQEKRTSVDGASVDLILSDFAGQESYHSHTYFLTERSIFLLVWKLSAVEQDFHSSGINAREEERLQRWMAEVLAKFPDARIVLVATHLDELRVQGQRSVEMILSKVEAKLRTYIDDLLASNRVQESSTPPPPGLKGNGISSCNMSGMSVGGRQRDPRRILAGNFAVSCKTRQILAAGTTLRHLSGEKISGLLRYLAVVAKEDCLADREYPAAAIPARHARLMEDLEEVKRRHPLKLLMRMGEFVQMAVNVGIDSEGELLQVARLLHSWDILYLFHPHSLEVNTLLVLHPRWLNRMAAALFSYAHLLRTPLHLRSMIGGLEYTVSNAEVADMCLMRKGFLRWPLARVLFYKPLADFLHRPPDDADVAMCLELLESMQLLYPVEVQSDDFDVLAEEVAVDPNVGRPVVITDKLTRYFIPSLAPQLTPPSLKKVAPVLFHRGARVRYDFNLLPDELWWRLQCALHAYFMPVTVYQPAVGGTEDEDLLFDGYRLREADEEHNRWRDSLWLAAPSCRVLVYRESLNGIAILAAETVPRSSAVVLQALEEAMAKLLHEYRGVRRSTYVACPNRDCGGWLGAEKVASAVRVTCPTCGKNFASNEVISSGAETQSTPRFSQALLVEAGELLAFCLSHRSCLHMCEYLGISYKGPTPTPSRADLVGEDLDPAAATTEEGEGDAVEQRRRSLHAEYLHALDKVIQAVLFRSWVLRVEEQERRRRMLEDELTPSFF